MKTEKLHVVYIRPSRYDDDGYVIRHWRGVLPSNTLYCLEHLTRSLADSELFAPDFAVTVETLDDTVQRIPLRRIARMNRKPGVRVVVGLTGVQTNQFARASDLALQLRAMGVQVMIGGFHVSGMLALFDKPSLELQRLMDAGVSLVKGEAEAPGALEAILRGAANGTMQSIYDIREFPELLQAPVPRCDPRLQQRYLSKTMATIDTSRGCPFNCSFCTIINVQGRKMRHRSAACVLKAIEENYAHGIRTHFFTDDNFSRNPAWEEILDGMIALRARGLDVNFMMQTDTQAHSIPRFLEKAEKAGCYLSFIGMETVNPKNLEAIGKGQNHVEEYADMVRAWHSHDILVHVGYIVGLPHDTPESVRQDMETLHHKVQVDLASLFMLVPLPGSRDHYDMVQRGVPADADPNNFDGLHETFQHSRMRPGEWRNCYDQAMAYLYSKENIVMRLLRFPDHYSHRFWLAAWYRYAAMEGVHPMATGLFRLKERLSRRAVFPREGLLRYSWRRVKDAAHEIKRYASLFFEFQEIWMLTCKPRDPRWAVLADLRCRWETVQDRIVECGLRGRCDEAAQETRAMIAVAAERIRQLSAGGGALSASARRQLADLSQDVDRYLSGFDMRQGWMRVADGHRYISERILAGYEEAAIRYVAQRRRFNAYRRDLADRIRSGRILSMDVGRLPFAAACELFFAGRFMIYMLKSKKAHGSVTQSPGAAR